MTKKKRNIELFLGLLVLTFIPLWIFLVAPVIKILPENYVQSAGLIHSEDNRFEIGGDWSGKTIAVSSINDRVTNNDGRTAQVESIFKVESLTGETLFSLNQKFYIDRITMLNNSGGTAVVGGSYFLFPRNVTKQSYSWWSNAFGESFKIDFVDTQKINGLTVFHFRGEKKNINDTQGYTFLPLVPEKYQALSDGVLDVYVEPVTGIVVDYQDEGTSYYVAEDKIPVWEIAAWTNKFNNVSIADRIEMIKESRYIFLAVDYLIPTILILLGLIMITRRVGV